MGWPVGGAVNRAIAVRGTRIGKGPVGPFPCVQSSPTGAAIRARSWDDKDNGVTAKTKGIRCKTEPGEWTGSIAVLSEPTLSGII